MLYVSGRVVTRYAPVASVGRQMRPVGNGVSTHTNAWNTGTPFGSVTCPTMEGPGAST